MNYDQAQPGPCFTRARPSPFTLPNFQARPGIGFNSLNKMKVMIVKYFYFKENLELQSQRKR